MLISPYKINSLQNTSKQRTSNPQFAGHQPTSDEIKSGKEWVNADLEDAKFYTNWVLDNSVLAGANLKDTTFYGNRLFKANLYCTNLSGTTMRNINAGYANFSSAKTEAGTKADFSNAFLENARFTNAQLDNAAFTKSALSQAVFNNASIDNSNFDNARAINTGFDGVSAHSASFFDSILNSSRFTDAKLDDAKFTRADIRATKFKNASLTNAQLNNSIAIESDFRGAKLGKANLANSNFDNAKFNFSDLTAANLSNASLENANFQEADLQNANLQNVKAAKANFAWIKNGDGIHINSAILDNANFYSANLPNAQLSSSHLNGAFLQGAILDGVKMGQIQAKEADFKGAHLHSAILSASELQHSNFIGADLNQAEVIAANLSNARLAAAQLEETNFTNSNLNNADISSTSLDSTNFANSDIQKASFVNTKAVKPDFSDCNLQGSKFIDSGMFSPNFCGATLQGCLFNNTQLYSPSFNNVKAAQSDFRSASIISGELNNSTFAESNFEKAKIEQSTLEDSDFSQVNFIDAEITDTSLKHAVLTGVSLNAAKLTSVNLTGANLDGANLANTKFHKVNLSNTDLSKVRNIKLADFENSYYEDGLKPKLPDGITPDQLGIRKIKNENNSRTTIEGQFFSLYSNKQFEKLSKQVKRTQDKGAKAEYTFFKYLAQGKNSADWMKEFINEGERVDTALENLRESFKGQEVSDLYTPETRNGKSTEDEEFSLKLSDFSLKTDEGHTYPDLNRFKEICLAQQLYSNYLQHASEQKAPMPGAFSSNLFSWGSSNELTEERKAEFWRERLQSTFGDDYEAETGNSPDSEHFLNWVTEKYNLYPETKFDFNRSLEAAYTEPEDEEKAGLASVMGYAKVKDKLKEQIIAPLTFPMISQLGASKPQKGWILYGDPGTGKSNFAKAVSNQMGLHPVEVSLSSIGSSYENQTVRNLTTQFEKAKRLAQRHGASVVLLDEMNQVGDSRQKGGNSKSDLTNALLNTITRYVEQAKENIVCIGTTNDIQSVDPALKRAGRLGAHEEIDLPDQVSRKAFLDKQLPQGDHFLKPLKPYESGRSNLIDYMAEKTEGKPTSALKQLVDRLTGGYKDQITQQDVDTALDKMRLELRKQI